MAEKIARGKGWTKDDVKLGKSPWAKELWAKRGDDIVRSSNQHGLDPNLLLAYLAESEESISMPDSALYGAAKGFAESLERSGGSVKQAVAEGVLGQDTVSKDLESIGALPQDESVLNAQERILSRYAEEREIETTDPTVKRNSAQLFDEGGNLPGTRNGSTLSPTAPIGQQDYTQRSRYGVANTLTAGTIGFDRPGGRTDGRYTDVSSEAALAYDLPDDVNTGTEDRWNAFIVGLSTTVTDAAVYTGAAGVKLGLGGNGLLDWGLSGSRYMEKRYHVDNPDYWTALAGGAGSMMVPMISGGAGRMMAQGIGRKLLMKWIEKRASQGLITKIGGAVASRAGRIGFAAGAAAPEAYTQAGNTYRALIENGATADEAFTAATTDLAVNIGILGASDYILGAGLGRGWKEIVKNAAARAASEGTQEILQGASQRWQVSRYTDNDFHILDQSMLMEGAVGATLGALVGTGMAAVNERGAGSPLDGEAGPPKAGGAIEDAAIGLRKGTTRGIQSELVDHFLGKDFKPNSPEETAALLRAFVYVENLANQSTDVVGRDKIPNKVAEDYKEVRDILEDPQATENHSEQELRALTLYSHALENHILANASAARIYENHTLEEQSRALDLALDLFDKHGPEGVSPAQTMAVAGLVRNLANAGQLSPEARTRLNNASNIWGSTTHLSEGRAAATYAGVVLKENKNEEGQAIGWSVVYRANAGHQTGELSFEGDNAKDLAKAEFRRLVKEGVSPEDFGVSSPTRERVKNDEAVRAEKGSETAQAKYKRLVKQINSLDSEVRKIEDRMMSDEATDEDRAKMHERIMELEQERDVYFEEASTAYREFGDTDRAEVRAELAEQEKPAEPKPEAKPKTEETPAKADDGTDRLNKWLDGIDEFAILGDSGIIEKYNQSPSERNIDLVDEERSMREAGIEIPKDAFSDEARAERKARRSAESDARFREKYPEEAKRRDDVKAAREAKKAGGFDGPAAKTDGTSLLDELSTEEPVPVTKNTGDLSPVQHAREHWKRSENQDTDERTKAVGDLAKRLGVELVFAETTLEDDGLFGVYDAKHKQLIVRRDASAEEAHAYVAAHELGHHLHGDHRQLVAALVSSMKNRDIDIENYIDDRIKYYQPRDLSNEYVADKLARVLLSEKGIDMVNDYLSAGDGVTVEEMSAWEKVFAVVRKWLPKIGRGYAGKGETSEYGRRLSQKLMDRLNRVEAQVRESAKLRLGDDARQSQPGQYEDIPAGSDMGDYVSYTTALRDSKVDKGALRSATKYVSGAGRLYVLKSLFPSAARKVNVLRATPEKQGETRTAAETRPRNILRSQQGMNEAPRKAQEGRLGERSPAPAERDPRDVERRLEAEDVEYASAVTENVRRLNSLTKLASESIKDINLLGVDNTFNTMSQGVFTQDAHEEGLAIIEQLAIGGLVDPAEALAALEFIAAMEETGNDTVDVRMLKDSMLEMLYNEAYAPAEERALDEVINNVTRDLAADLPGEEALLGGPGSINAVAVAVESWLRDRFTLNGDFISTGRARYILAKLKLPKSLSIGMNAHTPDGYGQTQLTGIADLAAMIAKNSKKVGGDFKAIEDTKRAEEAKRSLELLGNPHDIDRPGSHAFFGPLKNKPAKTADPDAVGGPEVAQSINIMNGGLVKEGQSLREWVDSGTQRFYTAFVDRNHTMKMMVEELTDSSLEEKQDLGVSVYHNLKGLMTGWGSAADLNVSKGMHSFLTSERFRITSGHENGRGKTVKGLGQIIDEHGIDLKGDGWGMFNAYLQAKRILTLAKEKPKSIPENFDLGRYSAIVSKLDAKHGPKYAAAAADLDVAARGLMMFLAEMGNLSVSARNAILATEFYMPLHSATIKEQAGLPGERSAIRGVDSLGLLDADHMLPPLDELAAQMAQVTHAGYANYTKARLADLLNQQLNEELGMVLDLTTGMAAHTKGTIVGSKSGGKDLKDQIIAGIGKLKDQFRLDDATVAGLINVVENGADADINHQIWLSKVDLGDDLVGYFKEGKFGVMRVNRDLAKSFENDPVNAERIMVKFLSKSTRLLRTGATLDPGFWARNFIRDVPSALIGAIGMIKGPKDAINFYKTLLGEPGRTGAVFDVLRGNVDPGYLLHGGGMSTLSSRDAEADFEERRQHVQNLQKRGAIKTAGFVVRHPLQFLELMSSGAETVTRLTVYRMRHDQIAKDKPKMPEHLVSQLASLDSRDATLDFARAGEYGSVINKLSPFWNAMVQGVDKMARSFKNDPVGTMIRGGTMITLPTMALYAANHDKEWYRKLPTWEKNAFWIFSHDGENIIRVPKPFDWGMLFGSLPERVADQMLEHDPDGFADWMGQFSQMALGVDLNNLRGGDIKSIATGLPITPAGQALMSLVTGYDPFTQRKVVPLGLEKVQTSQQYTHSTSWMSRRMIDILENKMGTKPFLSPIEIDQFIRQTTGGLGTAILQGGSAILRKVDPGAPQNDFHKKDWRDRALLIKAFNVDEHSSNTYYSTKFHDAMRYATEAQATMARIDRTGDVQAAEKLRHLRPLALVADEMRAGAELAKGLTDDLRILEVDQNMDSYEKRETYRKIIDARDMVYKDGLERYRAMIELAEDASANIKAVDKLKGRRK